MTVEMDDWHHLTLVVKYNSADTQNWNKTMNANGYWDIMVSKLETTNKKACVDIPSEQWTHRYIGEAKIRGIGVEENVDDYIAGFLGVHIKRHSDGSIEMTQTGLIQCINKASSIQQATFSETPDECCALCSEKDEINFTYKSVIRMLG